MEDLYIVFDNRATPDDADDATVLEAFHATSIEDAVYEARECWANQGAVLYDSQQYVAHVDDYKNYPKNKERGKR